MADETSQLAAMWGNLGAILYETASKSCSKENPWEDIMGIRSTPFQFVVAALAAAASVYAIPLSRGETAAETAAVEVKIISTEFRFLPAKIWVVAGRPVTLLLDNSEAETEHRIVVPAFGLRMDVKAGETGRTTIVFYTPGEYDFLCDLPGHGEAGMRGKFIVR